MAKIIEGTRVKFATAFCQRIGAGKDITDLRGTVVRIIRPIGEVPERAKVLWDDDLDSEPSGCLIQNLERSER